MNLYLLLKVLDHQVKILQLTPANQLEHLLLSSGAVTIKIIKRTNITSTNGVTFISLIGSFLERLNLNAIFYIIDKNLFEKLSIFEIYLLEVTIKFIISHNRRDCSNRPRAVANKASAIPGATMAKTCISRNCY